MPTKRSVVEVRAALLDALKADLIGPFLPEDHPGGGEETLSLPPSRWYLTGFLAPKAGAIPDVDDQDSQGELAVGVEGQADDEGVVEPEPSRTRRFPASMGLSVYLPPARGKRRISSRSPSATPTTTRSRSTKIPRRTRSRAGSASLMRPTL